MVVGARSKPAAGKTSFHEVRRGHAADAIFAQLAAAVLRGELTPGEPLPPERVLGEQFGVSRIILRAAVHRLAEVGLVRVRQGGASIVLDPAEAGDIRLIGLYYSLDPGGDAARAIRRDAIEKTFLQGFSLIDVCARRGSTKDKAGVLALAMGFDLDHATEADFTAFEEDFWRAVARAGKNRIFGMEVAWWYDTLGDARPAAEHASTLAVRIAFYRELSTRLVEGNGASQYYHAVCSPQLDALFGKGHKR